MAPFHFFRVSCPIIAGISSRRMLDPESKPFPFLPSKTIHCEINPIFTSYSVAKIQSDFKTLSSRKLSSSSLFPPPWMHHFAMKYAFTEVAAQASAILAFYLKARGNWGGELEAQKSLERIEMLLSSFKAYHTKTAQKLDKIEHMIGKLNTKLDALERENRKEKDGGQDKKKGWFS